MSFAFGAAVATTCLLLVAYVPGTAPVPNIEMDPLFAVIIVLAAQRDLDDRPGLLRSRGLVYAGGASYAFYLVHQFVLIECIDHIGRGFLIALLTLVVAGVAAVALHQGVELPCQRLLLSLRGAPAPSEIAFSPIGAVTE
jgi:peptidoglycan/LPS O-acetylase OafA/YrhL